MGMGSEADMFIITGGTKNYYASSYQFHAEKEAFTIKKLTIINDDDCIYGTSSNGFDKPKDTKAISQVNIAYKDKKGKKKTVIGGPLTNGSYTFNNLDFYIKKDGYNLLWVYADTYPITSGNFSISGSRFCIGLKDKNAKTEFEAVGESSGQSTQYKTTNKFAIDASRFIRKSKPVFSKVTQSSSAMPSSNGDIFKFNVKAEGGDVSFARLTFDIKTKGLNSAKDDIYNFELRNSSGAINDHHIWGRSLSFNAASVYLKDAKSGSGLQDADTAALGVDDETYKIVVTFDNEQTITVNQTETYTLRASIAGATTDDTIEVALAQVDETAKAIISSNYDNNNGANNTGHIIGNTNIKSDSLFSGSAGTGDDDNEFFNDTVNNWVNFRNIIWSDRSGGDVSSKGGAPTSSVHSYPTISGSSTSGAGTVVDYSGTIDWTNGEGLQVKKAGLYKFKK